jgi:hypothetical protein
VVEGFSGFGIEQGLLQWRRSEIRVFIGVFLEGLKRHRLEALVQVCILVRKFSEIELVVFCVVIFSAFHYQGF